MSTCIACGISKSVKKSFYCQDCANSILTQLRKRRIKSIIWMDGVLRLILYFSMAWGASLIFKERLNIYVLIGMGVLFTSTILIYKINRELKSMPKGDKNEFSRKKNSRTKTHD